MKRIIFIFAVIAAPLLAHAQKCDALDVDEKDAFTNEQVRSGTGSIGGKLWHCTLTLKQVGTTYRWELQIKYAQHFREPMKKGEVVYCKLENGKVIKLVVDKDYDPMHETTGAWVVTTFLPKGDVPPQDMTEFSQSPLAKIRVVVAGKNLEPGVSGKQGSRIQEVAKCLTGK